MASWENVCENKKSSEQMSSMFFDWLLSKGSICFFIQQHPNTFIPEFVLISFITMAYKMEDKNLKLSNLINLKLQW